MDARLHAGQILRGGGLLDERDGVKQAMRAREQFRPAARHVHALDRTREERIEHPAEELVFLQQFVLVEPLSVSQLAKLHRLGNHGRIGADGPRRTLEIVGDPFDQHRHMIEQVFGWEDAIGVQMDPLTDAGQPPPRQVVAGLAKAVGEDDGQRAIEREIHSRREGRLT